MKKMIPMAICYDFDGTLSPGNMQEYGFLRAVQAKSATAFWDETNTLGKREKADDIAAYMWVMLEKLKAKKIKPTRAAFRKFAADIELFAGVPEWFDRINTYAKKRGVLLHHYIISSGLKEMIEGTSIAKKFHTIFASTFMYNKKGEAFWPGVMLNYTSKTQFIFRINKGCEDLADNDTVNKYIPRSERPMPFENMIYVGDGLTDIPCMKMVKAEGGHSVAVFDGRKKKPAKIDQLVADNRVNAVKEADYRPGRPLEKYIQSVIDKIAAINAVKAQEIKN